ncbi:MAG: hypothetical protein OES38_03725 [Gammaproteobacteria bacterium]|nr:hypothetical protein [Gammaproteobacteria bacterium]
MLQDVLVIRVASRTQLGDILDIIDEASAIQHYARRLWVVSGGLNLSPEQIDEVAKHGRNRWPAPSRVAYVGPADLTFGIMRMLEVYTERDGFDTRVFREERDALAWLHGCGD